MQQQRIIVSSDNPFLDSLYFFFTAFQIAHSKYRFHWAPVREGGLQQIKTNDRGEQEPPGRMIVGEGNGNQHEASCHAPKGFLQFHNSPPFKMRVPAKRNAAGSKNRVDSVLNIMSTAKKNPTVT
jgi:hypothetical protein